MAYIIGPNAQIVPYGSLQNRNGIGSDVQSFLSFLSSPDTQIPLQSNFLIVFDRLPGAFLNGNTFPASFENQWNIQNTQDALIQVITSNQNSPFGGYACLFAQGFSSPTENVDIARQNVLSGPSGGLIGGLTSAGRAPFNSLDIDFLETNSSFIDFVIRPWVALIGHYGLINRDPNSAQNVKADISAVLFDKNNNNNIRKIFSFKGCAPTGVGTIAHVYGDDRASTANKVSFQYNTYGISYSSGTASGGLSY